MMNAIKNQTLPPETRIPRLRWIGFGVAGIMALGLLFAFDPAQFRFFPQCVFHQLTGLNCPGCGGQRAVHHLLHGEFIRALHYNTLLIVLLPLGVWALTRQVARVVWQRELPVLFKHHGWPWLLAGAVISFGVLRNLPLPVFSWMSP